METANDISIGEVPSRTEDIRGIRERTSMAQSTKKKMKFKLLRLKKLCDTAVENIRDS